MMHTVSFYRYCYVPAAKSFSQEHLNWCKLHDIKGRIIIADEGINGTFCASLKDCKRYMDNLEQFPHFKGIDYKQQLNTGKTFLKIKVKYKKEIVHSGLPARVMDKEVKKTHINPTLFKKCMGEKDTIILDVRSKYEHQVGKFKAAKTLDLNHFRDFSKHLPALLPHKDKKIVTYCTGGIRCEKVTAFLLQQGFHQVYQLQGGILAYGQREKGKDFQGKCYVFDNRVTFDVNQINPITIGKCRHCGRKTSKVINCANSLCNEHFLQCELCGKNMDGCCGKTCMESEKKRPYDGTGYYIRKQNN